MTKDETRAERDLPVHEQVYRQLRARIMHGAYVPGAAFTVRGVGADFGVSMTPAREAIRRLVAEGALTISASGRVSTPELANDRIEVKGRVPYASIQQFPVSTVPGHAGQFVYGTIGGKRVLCMQGRSRAWTRQPATHFERRRCFLRLRRTGPWSHVGNRAAVTGTPGR